MNTNLNTNNSIDLGEVTTCTDCGYELHGADAAHGFCEHCSFCDGEDCQLCYELESIRTSMECECACGDAGCDGYGCPNPTWHPADKLEFRWDFVIA